jgi:hypothetical protein
MIYLKPSLVVPIGPHYLWNQASTCEHDVRAFWSWPHLPWPWHWLFLSLLPVQAVPKWASLWCQAFLHSLLSATNCPSFLCVLRFPFETLPTLERSRPHPCLGHGFGALPPRFSMLLPPWALISMSWNHLPPMCISNYSHCQTEN